MAEKRAALHEYLRPKLDQKVFGGIDRKLPFEVHSIRPSLRNEWNGWSRLQWVIELTQRVAEYFEPSKNGGRPD